MGVAEVPGASRRGRLRLTRRGRAVVTILLLLLVGAAAATLSPASRADPARSPSGVGGQGAPAAVVVRPGDSLWSLAERHRPDHDPVAVVDEIRRLNGMDGYLVYVGQRLLVPTDR